MNLKESYNFKGIRKTTFVDDEQPDFNFGFPFMNAVLTNPQHASVLSQTINDVRQSNRYVILYNYTVQDLFFNGNYNVLVINANTELNLLSQNMLAEYDEIIFTTKRNQQQINDFIKLMERLRITTFPLIYVHKHNWFFHANLYPFIREAE